jgi:hypothetical protein
MFCRGQCNFPPQEWSETVDHNSIIFLSDELVAEIQKNLVKRRSRHIWTGVQHVLLILITAVMWWSQGNSSLTMSSIMKAKGILTKYYPQVVKIEKFHPPFLISINKRGMMEIIVYEEHNPYHHEVVLDKPIEKFIENMSSI